MIVLDIHTLFISYVICSVTMVVLLLVSYRSERPTSVALWMIWLTLKAGGLILYALRGQISPWLSIVVANMCITGALSCALGAMQTFFQRPLRPALMAAPVAASILVTTLLLDTAFPRIQAINVLLALQSAMVALAVMRGRPAGDLTSLFVSVPFAVNAATIAARSVSIAMEPEYHLLTSNAPQTATFLMLLVTQIASSFGFVLMLRERAESEIKNMALHDSLTGCLNRRSYELIVQKELARTNRGGATLSLLLMDIDHFKQVNDTFGHVAGDGVLRDLVRRTERVLRSQDFIFRYGGEEFCILLPRTGYHESMAIAERIRQNIASDHAVHDGTAIRYTVSIGVTKTSDGGLEQRTRLFRQADQAMYAAKQGGRNRVVHFDDLNQDVGLESQTS